MNEVVNGNTLMQAYCTKSVLDFTKYFFLRNNKKKFIVAEHHRKISKALDDVISGKVTKLIINVPPRYGKTELAVKNFIAAGLALNPRSKFIHLSFSDSLANDNSEEIRDIVKSDAYQQLFPYVKISKSSDAKKKWYTVDGGGVYATSTGGQVTGFGAGEVDPDGEDDDLLELLKEIESVNDSYIYETEKFAGAIVIDDPLKPEDALSDLVRERVNQRFETTIRSRVNSRNTPIIIIMQRLHERDLCGYLIEQEPDEWTVLSLPAISTDEQGNEIPLWEHKHTLRELYKIKKADSFVFATQYMQDPMPLEGLLLPISELQFADISQIPEEDIVFRFSVGDPADKGGDKYSMPFMHVVIDGDQFAVFVKDTIHSKDGIEANTERIRERIRDLNIEEVAVETNGVGVAAALQLKNALNNHTKIQPFVSKQEKEVRILSHYEFVKKYFVFDKEYKNNPEYNLFIKDLTTYLKEGDNKHKKDAIDVCCSAAHILKVKYKSFFSR